MPSHKILAGQGVILLRETLGPEKRRLLALGARIFHCPVLKRRTLLEKGAFGSGFLFSFQWIVFTSAGGVLIFKSLLGRLRLPEKARIACVGPETGRAFQKIFKRKPQFIPSSFTTEAAAKELPSVRGARVLLIRSANADKRMETILRLRGAVPVRRSVYRVNRAGTSGLVSILARGNASYVFFGSATQARAFAAVVPQTLKRRVFNGSVRAVAIGPETSKALRQAGIPHQSAPVHTFDGMIDKILGVRSCI